MLLGTLFYILKRVFNVLCVLYAGAGVRVCCIQCIQVSTVNHYNRKRFFSYLITLFIFYIFLMFVICMGVLTYTLYNTIYIIQYESNLLIKYSKFESRKFVPALEIVISQNMVSGPVFYDRIYIPAALIYGGMTWRR